MSVIIPTWNTARYLPRAIDSVLNQSFPDLEILVVDDGSVDDTRQLIQNKYARTVRYVLQAHMGPSAARNRGITNARGRYLSFLDADDWFAPNHLAVRVARLEADPSTGWVYSDGHYVSEATGELSLVSECFQFSKRSSLAPDLLRVLLLEGPFFPPLAPLVRRRMLDLSGPFDESIDYLEDYDFWIRLSAVSRATYLNLPTYFVLDRPDSRSKNRLLMAQAGLQVRAKSERLYPEIVRERWPRWRIIEAGLWRVLYEEYGAQGHHRMSLKALFRSLRAWPFQESGYPQLVLAAFRSILFRSPPLDRATQQ